MSEKLLLLDSIVYLKEATAKHMVVGRGTSFDDGNDQTFSDYVIPQLRIISLYNF